MTSIAWPPGMEVAQLARSHKRSQFSSGQPLVDAWFKTKALQNQAKHLSVTKVLLDRGNRIAGYYTLASGQVAFDELPADVTKSLPKRTLPIAVLAWMGVEREYQGRRLGARLLSQALRDCYYASNTFPFVAVVLDCIDDAAKRFYKKWDFSEVPGHPYRLFLSAAQLAALMSPDDE